MPAAPLQESAEARIAEIARAHIKKFGAGRATVVGIAAEAGMTHANVYRYYPTKMELFEEITASWLRPLEAQLREAADGVDPAYDKLERILFSVHRAYRRQLESEPELFDLLIDALLKDRASARKHRSRVQSEVQRVVEEGISSGAFALADRRRALSLDFRRRPPLHSSRGDEARKGRRLRPPRPALRDRAVAGVEGVEDGEDVNFPPPLPLRGRGSG